MEGRVPDHSPKLPPIMNSPIPPTPPSERIKLHEAVAVTALVAFVAVTLTTTVAVLTARLYVVELLDHIKPKGKGIRHAL
jgi:hypothetical protein